MKFLLFLSAECRNLEETVSVLKKSDHEVGLLLVQDGVYLLDRGCPEASNLKALSIPIFASQHHVEERGIGSRLITEAKLVDYSAMVDIMMEKYDKIITM